MLLVLMMLNLPVAGSFACAVGGGVVARPLHGRPTLAASLAAAGCQLPPLRPAWQGASPRAVLRMAPGEGEQAVGGGDPGADVANFWVVLYMISMQRTRDGRRVEE